MDYGMNQMEVLRCINKTRQVGLRTTSFEVALRVGATQCSECGGLADWDEVYESDYFDMFEDKRFCSFDCRWVWDDRFLTGQIRKAFPQMSNRWVGDAAGDIRRGLYEVEELREYGMRHWEIDE